MHCGSGEGGVFTANKIDSKSNNSKHNISKPLSLPKNSKKCIFIFVGGEEIFVKANIILNLQNLS